MQDFFGVKVDTSGMTLEELQEARDKSRELFSYLEHMLLLRKMSEHKHSS